MRFLLPLAWAWLTVSAQAGSLQFSKDEWKDPGQLGSLVWLRNPGSKTARLEKVFLKSDGLVTFARLSLKIGPATYVFKPSKTTRGLWIGAIDPQAGKRGRRNGASKASRGGFRQPLRIRARDSVAVSGLEWSHHQSATPTETKLYESFYLELTVQPLRGEPCAVKISQSAAQYIIPDEGAKLRRE